MKTEDTQNGNLLMHAIVFEGDGKVSLAAFPNPPPGTGEGENMPIAVCGEDQHGAHHPYTNLRADTLVPLDESLSLEVGWTLRPAGPRMAFQKSGFCSRAKVFVTILHDVKELSEHDLEFPVE